MNIEIAERLQKLRKENGYSQEELADALGISRQAVSKWERAESSPDTDNLILLARLYNISLDELLSTDETNDEIKHSNEDKKRYEESIVITDNEGQRLVVKDGIHCYDKDGDEVKPNKAQLIILPIATFLIILIFLITGFVMDIWYYNWILFLFIPIIGSIISMISKKKLSDFAYPILVTAIYCFIGMKYELWHPWWWLFITIPVYYGIVKPIDKYIFKSIDEDDK